MYNLLNRVLIYSNKVNFCKNINYLNHYVRYAGIFGGKITFKGRKIKDKDNVPENLELIYRTTMGKYVINAHAVAIISTALIIPSIGYTNLILQELTFPQTDFLGHFTFGGGLDTVIFTASFFIFNTVIIYFSGQIPLRIYFDSVQQRYTAIFRSWIPFKLTKIEYGPGEVKLLPSKGILPWRDSRHLLQNSKKIILLENAFRTPSDYQEMITSPKENK